MSRKKISVFSSDPFVCDYLLTVADRVLLISIAYIRKASSRLIRIIQTMHHSIWGRYTRDAHGRVALKTFMSMDLKDLPTMAMTLSA